MYDAYSALQHSYEIAFDRVLAAARAVGRADFLLSAECRYSDQDRLIELGKVITDLRAGLGFSALDDLPRAYPPPAHNLTANRTHGKGES